MRGHRSRSVKKSLYVVLTFFVLPVAAVWACSVPVFRYALEQWSSDDYEVILFHQEPLSSEELAKVKRYQRAEVDVADPVYSNVKIRTVDLQTELSEMDRQIWDKQSAEAKEQLPWMVVRYPKGASVSKQDPLYFDVWSVKWNEENFNKLIDSPGRRDIARRLIQGETAVWVLVRSGNVEKDEAARKALLAGLEKANQTLKLPEIDEQDVQDGLVTIDPDKLRINFTTWEVDRTDASEQAFLGMLLGSEDDLQDYAEEPMAFPVFGRGRILYALIGAGINEDTLLASCEELIGPCTCEVKDQNPGVDLVMTVNWDNLIESTLDLDKELPPLLGLGGLTEPAEKGEAGEMSDRERLAKLQAEVGDEATATNSENPSEDNQEKAGAATNSEPANEPVKDKPLVDTEAQAGGLKETVQVGVIGFVGLAVLVLALGTFFIMKKSGSDN